MSEVDALDLTLLQLLRRRDRYDALSGVVPMAALDPAVRVLLTDYAAYFKEFTGAAEIRPAEFWTWCAGFRHRDWKDDARALHKAVLKRAMKQPLDPDTEDGLMARLVALATADAASRAVAAYNEGADVDITETLRSAADTADRLLHTMAKDPQERTPIEDILARVENDWGFTHILPGLNEALRPMTPGEAIAVAAPVGAGKTAWLANMAVRAAREIDGLWPGENRSVLWLVNEGSADKMVRRAFQVALGCTTPDMIRDSKLPSDTHRNLLVQKYAEALGGRPGALRIFNAHGMSCGEILKLVRKYRAGMVLLDMLAHFPGPALQGDARTDQRLEGMWQWVREKGAQHEFVAVGSVQMSAEGYGVNYPPLTALRDSKIGSQGAMDTCIMMGMLHDPMMAGYRYISVPKTKEWRDGAREPRLEIIFSRDRQQFSEPS